MAEGEATSDVDVEMAGTTSVGNVTDSTAHPTSNLARAFSTPDFKPDFDDSKPTLSSSPTGSARMKSAPKKKGTAAATKRIAKKPKRPKTKNSKSKPGTAGGGAENDGGGGGGGGSSDDEIDNGPYCLCRGPDDHRWMISCDVCEDWFHGECVDLDKTIGEKLVERFVCPNCTDGQLNYTKYRKTCSLSGCTNAARLYTPTVKDRSVFCSNDHCDAWWASMLAMLPTKAASKTALEVLTQEDLIGLLIATADTSGWKLGDRPFGTSERHSHSNSHSHSHSHNHSHSHSHRDTTTTKINIYANYHLSKTTGSIEGLWANGLPTRPDVLSEEEQSFLQTSAAERLALGNEIVQYKKMMQLLDWANERRQTAIEAGKFTKDSCGYDWRLDTVSVRVQFAAWLDTPEGQAIFKAGKLDAPPSLPPPPPPPPSLIESTTTITTTNNKPASDATTGATDPAIRGTCDRKRCKSHVGWYKLLMGVVRVLIKETATAAAAKLEAEEAMRAAAEARYERRQLENNYVEVLSED
ncbi:hypothetical protein GGR50DRAFT_160393 [Xylaria sp. CBS 124048]|nr:hypothetical protein GGR50DRAFT_160393 [Xylaria sp. CBS 124048]